MKFIIKDWASNTCFGGIRFDSADDAWEFLFDKIVTLSDEEAEEELQEYYVTEEGE